MDLGAFKYKYAETMFPISDDEEDIVSNSVEKMLKAPDDEVILSARHSPITDNATRKEEHVLSPSSISPDRLSNSLQDELDSLAYSSQPQTPCESFISSNDYANPLSQIAYSSSYSDDMVDDSDEAMQPDCFKRSNYDTSALMYGNDDMTTFAGVVNCNDVLKTDNSKEISSSNTIVCCYRNFTPEEKSSSPTPSQMQADENYFSGQEQSPEENKKGKISGLQRHSLELIFAVTDRPSRGLVLHMASELGLHHITVKNFFSNGRRRLRRAAARLNDPERTRRENQRRKEKRRLAAIAATFPNGEKLPTTKTGDGSDAPREPPPILSPERRALMEKLAVKVQRSVAQKASQPAPFKQAPTTSIIEALSPKTHSSSVTLSNNFSSPIHLVPTSTTVTFLSSNETELASMLTYSTDQHLLLHSHQGLSGLTSPQNETYISDENSFVTIKREELEGPYSPTSWQTLLNA